MKKLRIGTKAYIRDQVVQKGKGVCVYCGKKGLRGRNAHVDHVIPESKGGAYCEDNLVLSCGACNIRKGAKDQQAYIAFRLKQIELEKETLLKLLKT